MSSSSSSLDDNSVRIRDHAITSTSETTEQTTETIKDVTRDIVEASSSIRELILTLHHIGAMEEVAQTAPMTLKTLKEVSNKVRSKITKKSLH
jgi:methyl-accepting chemotaxis protein